VSLAAFSGPAPAIASFGGPSRLIPSIGGAAPIRGEAGLTNYSLAFKLNGRVVKSETTGRSDIILDRTWSESIVKHNCQAAECTDRISLG
jgi:hypothetical protein